MPAHNQVLIISTYSFLSTMDSLVHFAVSWWVMLCYSFHHTHRSLRRKVSRGTFECRTPAMAVGIAKHPLSIGEILVTQVIGTGSITKPILANFGSGFRPTSAPCEGHDQSSR